MKRLSIVVLMIFLLGFISSNARAQTFDARFVEVLNNGTNYDVKIQIKANATTFALGTSNFIFSFDAASLSTPTLLTAHNFSGTNYLAMNLTGSGTSRSVNVELISAGTGTTVPTSFIDVATVRFVVTNINGSSNVQWNTGATVVYKDDEATIIDAGSFTNLNSNPLPIQLAQFAAAPTTANGVKLSWSTISETNNYGFDVQRSADGKVWATIPGSFIPGNGTTTAAHSYSYVDATPAGTLFYRLRQTDRDNTVHFSEPIQAVGTTTGIDNEVAPREFAVKQNYPNPFNPSTEIKFSVETAGPTTLRIYNAIGQEVATLFDGIAEPGRYYRMKFDGGRLASGLYFARVHSGNKTDVKKMLMVK